MTLKEKFKEYDQVAPVKEATILGERFLYRYYKNPDAKKDVTLLFLAGGTGLGDGFFYLYDQFAPNYSLISFNYPMAFKSVSSQAEAISLLIEEAGAHNVYLVGQSFGGLLAQVIAPSYPKNVKGLILSGTCGLGATNDPADRDFIEKLLDPKRVEKNIKTDKRLPIALLCPMMKLASFRLIKDRNMRRDFSNIVDICKNSMTKDYFVLMDTLLGDLRNHFWKIRKEDLLPFAGEALLVFSKEDDFFSDSLKQGLVDLFVNPVVEWDLKGGHLALMKSTNDYVALVNSFIKERNPSYRDFA